MYAPIKNRRGKVVYTEVDPALYYGLPDKGGESSKNKPLNTPAFSTMTVPALLEDTPQQDTYFMDDQQPPAPRITKVRL
jgi:hypothetical protein